MLDITEDIQSLTDFKRNTAEHIGRMKQTGRPLVLTVNGRAELVVQDAAAYQQLVDAVERAETVAGIRRGLEQMERGEGRPAAEVFAELRQKLGVADE